MIRVGPLDVRVGDVVMVHGRLREVVDLRPWRGGKMLHFADGDPYWLRLGEELVAQRR